MKWTFADTIGFVLSALITTVPFLLFLINFGWLFWSDDIKNLRHINPHECRFPAIIALCAAGLSSALAFSIERRSSEPEFRQFRRVFTYVGLALVTLIVLLITFFSLWGSWAVGILSQA